MKRSVFGAALLLCVVLSACGGGGSMAETAAASTPAAEAPMETEDNKFATGATVDSADGEFLSSQVYSDSDAKLIREGNLRIQTTSFDLAVEELEQLVVELGGYFQNASLRGGSYRNVNANRTGEYTIRVPAESYTIFMNQVGDLGYVTYRDESTQDIGERYYDTEAKLKTQKTKQDRLLSLLERAETMEDIISLENALSEVEYEIEQLSSTLNRYDSLVGFSTIYLTLDEVHKVTEETGVTNTLGQRMSKGFASSLEGLIQGFQDLLVWVSYHVFGLLVTGVVVALCSVIAAKKLKGKKIIKQKTDEPKQ